MHEHGENERCRDMIYRMLTIDHDREREGLAHGISKMIADYTTHPAAVQLDSTIEGVHATVVQRVLLIAAIANEPAFLQHLMEQENVCSSTLSQYAVNVAPQLIEQLLNGNLNLDDFAAEALHAYTIL